MILDRKKMKEWEREIAIIKTTEMSSSIACCLDISMFISCFCAFSYARESLLLGKMNTEYLEQGYHTCILLQFQSNNSIIIII